MLDYADLIARLEKLPVSEADGSTGHANFIAAEDSIGHIARALAWVTDVFGKWRGIADRASAALSGQ